MAAAPTKDESLEALRRTTEELLRAIQAGTPGRADTILQERAGQVEALRKVALSGSWTAAQRASLEKLTHMGQEARQRLAVRKAGLRDRMKELRAVQRNQAALKPYKPAKGRRLNIKL